MVVVFISLQQCNDGNGELKKIKSNPIGLLKVVFAVFALLVNLLKLRKMHDTQASRNFLIVKYFSRNSEYTVCPNTVFFKIIH